MPREETDHSTRIYKKLLFDSLAVYWNPVENKANDEHVSATSVAAATPASAKSSAASTGQLKAKTKAKSKKKVKTGHRPNNINLHAVPGLTDLSYIENDKKRRKPTLEGSADGASTAADSDAAAAAATEFLSDAPPEDWRRTVDAMLALTAADGRRVEKLEWLVEPILGEIRLIIESRPEFIDFLMPRLEIQILFQKIKIKIKARQFDNLLQFTNSLDRLVRAP